TLLRDHFKITAKIWKFLALRRAHRGPEDATWPQIDLAIGNGPGPWHEPVAEMRWRRPCRPDQLARNIDGAFKDKIKLRIDFDDERAGHDCVFSFRSNR